MSASSGPGVSRKLKPVRNLRKNSDMKVIVVSNAVLQVLTPGVHGTLCDITGIEKHHYSIIESFAFSSQHRLVCIEHAFIKCGLFATLGSDGPVIMSQTDDS